MSCISRAEVAESGESTVTIHYQEQFTPQAVAKQHMYDMKERARKAKKLLAVLQDHARQSPSRSLALSLSPLSAHEIRSKGESGVASGR